MSQLFIPLIMAAAGFFAAIATYRGIRQGGARFYTLEREAILRRASLTLFLSVILFIGAVGYLLFQQQQQATEEAVTAGEVIEGIETQTPTPDVEQFPPTEEPTPTVDANEPTITPTPLICRAIVDGTSGNGLTLRDVPGGAEMEILPDGTILTLLEDPAQEVNGFAWRKVRLIGGDEGWVAEDFLTIRAPCN
ncbi:MAG: SH3 domain-containing protein [Anaerolineales bacterium]|nr:SH3 domain-containing protein [Anaerolineales bacterium]